MMSAQPGRGWRQTLIWPIVAWTAVSLSGCGEIDYYAQAIHGQFALLETARPVDTLLDSDHVDERLLRRLRLAEEIRTYAVEKLGLPDNGSYRKYADLKRPYVVWDVFAARALSLRLKQSCFPIAGCVDYRGYYAYADADQYARDLRRHGWETFTVGVPAYSTLGYFDDPLLNTFLFDPEGELARIIFHELAHQVVYVRGDTMFNESFAVTVAAVGVARWLRSHPRAAKAYDVVDRHRRAFQALIRRYRGRLAELYAGTLPPAQKEIEKRRIFHEVRMSYARLRASWGGYAGFDRWIDSGLNNAKFGAFADYSQWVPAFRALLAQQHGNLPAFYKAVKQLAAQPADKRHAELNALAQGEVESSLSPETGSQPSGGQAN